MKTRRSGTKVQCGEATRDSDDSSHFRRSPRRLHHAMDSSKVVLYAKYNLKDLTIVCEDISSSRSTLQTINTQRRELRQSGEHSGGIRSESFRESRVLKKPEANRWVERAKMKEVVKLERLTPDFINAYCQRPVVKIARVSPQFTSAYSRSPVVKLERFNFAIERSSLDSRSSSSRKSQPTSSRPRASSRSVPQSLDRQNRLLSRLASSNNWPSPELPVKRRRRSSLPHHTLSFSFSESSLGCKEAKLERADEPEKSDRRQSWRNKKLLRSSGSTNVTSLDSESDLEDVKAREVPVKELNSSVLAALSSRPRVSLIRLSDAQIAAALSPSGLSDHSVRPSDNSERPCGNSERPCDNSERSSDNSVRPSDNSKRPSDKSVRPSDISERPCDNSVRPSDNSERRSDKSERPGDNSERPSDNSVRPSDNSASVSRLSDAEIAAALSPSVPSDKSESLPHDTPTDVADSKSRSAAPWLRIRFRGSGKKVRGNFGPRKDGGELSSCPTPSEVSESNEEWPLRNVVNAIDGDLAKCEADVSSKSISGATSVVANEGSTSDSDGVVVSSTESEDGAERVESSPSSPVTECDRDAAVMWLGTHLRKHLLAKRPEQTISPPDVVDLTGDTTAGETLHDREGSVRPGKFSIVHEVLSARVRDSPSEVASATVPEMGKASVSAQFSSTQNDLGIPPPASLLQPSSLLLSCEDVTDGPSSGNSTSQSSVAVARTSTDASPTAVPANDSYDALATVMSVMGTLASLDNSAATWDAPLAFDPNTADLLNDFADGLDRATTNGPRVVEPEGAAANTPSTVTSNASGLETHDMASTFLAQDTGMNLQTIQGDNERFDQPRLLLDPMSGRFVDSATSPWCPDIHSEGAESGLATSDNSACRSPTVGPMIGDRPSALLSAHAAPNADAFLDVPVILSAPLPTFQETFSRPVFPSGPNDLDEMLDLLEPPIGLLS